MTISWSTLLKIVVSGLLVLASAKLVPLFGLIFLAFLVAITISPLHEWVQRRGGSKSLGLLLCSVLLFGSLALFLGVVTPVAASQISGVIKMLPTFKEHVVRLLPESGVFRETITGVLQSPTFSNPEPLLVRFVGWGRLILESMIGFVLVLILAIYLLADGERVYHWLRAFLPEGQRRKLDTAVPEIGSVVSSYMMGQFITSLLCSVYTFTVLSFYHVPNALLLAVVAGIFDVLPIVGFFLSLVPALAMSFSQSPFTAASVGVLYVAYHLLENYIIVPRVYGNQLRLSTLTVLLSCLAAGLIAGVIGVIAALPLVASYPIIERIWLRPHLERDTVAKHTAIDETEHPST